jgi:RNA polymerase sigma-70 factor, ECF subfamily
MKGTAKCEPVAESFEALVAKHRTRIFRFALASLRDRDAAESVTQDCFVRAHRAQGQFRGDSSLQKWLMQIALNLIRDAARSRRFQFWRRTRSSAALIGPVSNLIPDAGMTPEERVSAAQQVQAIRGALDSLPRNRRAVFLLHFMEEMDAPEIAARPGSAKPQMIFGSLVRSNGGRKLVPLSRPT